MVLTKIYDSNTLEQQEREYDFADMRDRINAHLLVVVFWLEVYLVVEMVP